MEIENVIEDAELAFYNCAPSFELFMANPISPPVNFKKSDTSIEQSAVNSESTPVNSKAAIESTPVNSTSIEQLISSLPIEVRDVIRFHCDYTTEAWPEDDHGPYECEDAFNNGWWEPLDSGV
jgi:hypothetical protein